MHRIMLEATLHQENSFCTLTYSTDYAGPSASLEPKHLQDFLKRLRKAIAPRLIRYYAVGEYGDVTFRPHYHLALFNYPTCQFGRSRYRLLNRKTCCAACDLIRDTWGMGHIDLGTLEPKSAQYIAGYVTKKMTHRSDPRLEGREPEFARMSLRPGLGRDYIYEAASTFLQFNLETTQVDVPSTLRHGKKELPLGSYLVRKFRQDVGRDVKAPKEVLDRMDAEMLEVRKAAFDNSKSVKEEVLEKFKGKRSSILGKAKIHKQRKTL